MLRLRYQESVVWDYFVGRCVVEMYRECDDDGETMLECLLMACATIKN